MLDRFGRLLLSRRLRHSFYEWDAERLRRHQERRLAAMMRYIGEHSPYYRRLRAEGWDGQFETLPHMSKSEMVAHFDEINTAGLHKAELFAFAVQQERAGLTHLFNGRYTVGLSSGTSGTRLPTVLAPRERWQYGSLLFARSGLPDQIRQPRVMFSLRVNNPAFMEVRFLGVTIIYADYTCTPESLVELINRERLNVLAGPPSLLRMLARLRQLIEPRIEAIVSYAEVLDDETRGQLEAAFKAPVAQIYQSSEGFIASTCRLGKLHLNEDVVYVEMLDAGDTLGNTCRVVVSDMFRETLPFLRYELNDILEPANEPCNCGSSFRVIQRVHGRADDVFHLRGRDGGIRYLFPDYVSRSVNQASEDILEFQAIQHSLDHIEIRLQLKPNADREAIEAQIRRNLAYWAQKVDGSLGRLDFPAALPERNPNSFKLIRITRRFG